MGSEGFSFVISKSFGQLHLIPGADSLRLSYAPIVDGALEHNNSSAIEIDIPKEAVGGLWATTRAFLYGVESLDENIILHAADSDILIKLYRDKPKGPQGRLSGDEVCWLRLVTGRTEEDRRRIKLGPRDLLCIELACNAVLVMSAAATSHGAASSRTTHGSHGFANGVQDMETLKIASKAKVM